MMTDVRTCKVTVWRGSWPFQCGNLIPCASHPAEQTETEMDAVREIAAVMQSVAASVLIIARTLADEATSPEMRETAHDLIPDMTAAMHSINKIAREHACTSDVPNTRKHSA